MKVLNQMTAFYEQANNDERILPSHISLYGAILTIWKNQNYKCNIKIYRSRLMKYSHIRSIATYHKCMNELVTLGYLTYFPSYNRFKGCTIELNQL